MSRRYVHTCLRVLDPDASQRFYGALGFEPRGRLNFASAYNLYLGLPGRRGCARAHSQPRPDEPYDLGTGYNHMAITVDDIDAALAELAAIGVEPEKPPYHPGDREELPRIAFVADPDGYRIELIDGGAFPTPQDGLGALDLRAGHDVVAPVGPAHPGLVAAVVVVAEQDQRGRLAERGARLRALLVDARARSARSGCARARRRRSSGRCGPGGSSSRAAA